MLTRRGFTAGVVAASFAAPQTVRAESEATLPDRLAAIEAGVAGRLGVAMLDTGSGRRTGHRAGERFALCSTFKVLAGGAVLAKVDAGQESLSRRIRFSAADLVPYSPVTETRVGGDGMTLAEICEAAITRSDNTAGNLILASLGGPEGVTTFARAIGDPVSRLDRRETALNEALPGDPRDTTTPDAMTDDLHRLVLGNRLSDRSRAQLAAWLCANTTGGTRLRAGLPADWRVGDKTGAGDRGTTNDVAVIWPPGRAPIVLSVYLTDTDAPVDARNAAIAAVGRAVAQG